MKSIILLLFFLVGCAEKTVVKVEYKKILIPGSLLSPSRMPRLPSDESEKQVSKYILSLYKSNKINQNNIYQIRRIVNKHNKKTKDPYSKK